MITRENIKWMAQRNAVYVDTPSYADYRIRVIKQQVRFLLSTGEVLTIHPGFEWDEASVPFILMWAFPKSGKYAASALIHDALYYSTYKSQRFADDEFKYWMDVMINKNQSRLRWAFVRLFGFLYWNKNVSRPSERLKHNLKHIEIKPISS